MNEKLQEKLEWLERETLVKKLIRERGYRILVEDEFKRDFNLDLDFKYRGDMNGN